MSAKDSIDVRGATPDDIDAIFHIRTSVIDNHLSELQLAELGVTRESIVAAMQDGSMKVWCSVENSQVTGFVTAEPESGEISALFVHPDRAGCGAGSLLLDHAVDWLRGNTTATIHLHTGPETPAYGFYQRRGWVDMHVKPAGRPDSEDTRMELRT